MTAEFIHRFVPGAMASAPTILTLHGTGGDENDLVPLARMVDGDSAIISPRGRILENGQARFFRRLAEGVFDLDDLAAQTLALDRFLDAAAVGYHFDRARVVAFGYSNGANIAANLLLSVPGSLAGAVLLRPMLPFEPAPTPAVLPLKGVPVLIAGGKRDSMVPRPLTERLARVLAERGAEVRVSWQDAGHALTPNEMEETTAWWQRAFGG